MTARFVGEWLTLHQAATVLGLDGDDWARRLRGLADDGDIEAVELRPGTWRIRTSTVDDLAANPAWKRGER